MTLRKLLMWMAEASSDAFSEGRNSSRSTKLGITWMPQGGLSSKFARVRAARSSETAVTASEALIAYCVRGA